MEFSEGPETLRLWLSLRFATFVLMNITKCWKQSNLSYLQQPISTISTPNNCIKHSTRWSRQYNPAQIPNSRVQRIRSGWKRQLISVNWSRLKSSNANQYSPSETCAWTTSPKTIHSIFSRDSTISTVSSRNSSRRLRRPKSYPLLSLIRPRSPQPSHQLTNIKLQVAQ